MDVVRTQIRMLPDGRVSRPDSAKFLGKTSKTLANWATMGIGPKPKKVGGRVYYYFRDLEAFVATGVREASPTPPRNSQTLLLRTRDDGRRQ